jgi:hypothetical protein
MVAQDFGLQGNVVKKWCSDSYARLNKIFMQSKRPVRARKFMGPSGSTAVFSFGDYFFDNGFAPIRAAGF